MIKRLSGHLNQLLTKSEKRKMFLLSIWAIFVSFIEMMALVLILPFIAIVADSSLIKKNEYLNSIYIGFNFESDASFIYLAGILLIVLFLIRSVFNTMYLYQITKFSNLVVANLRGMLFEKDIRLLYTEYANKNIASLTNNILIESNNIYHIIFPVLTIMSESIVFIIVIGLLLYTNFQLSSILFIFFLIVSILVWKIFKASFSHKGKERALVTEQNHRLINESFGNFKYIKLSNIEREISSYFSSNSMKLSIVNTDYMILNSLPKYIFETLGLVIIVLITLYLYSVGSSVLSTIGLYVVSFYRLLPSVNKIINSLNSIKFYEKSFEKIFINLNFSSEVDVSDYKPLNFNSQIVLKNVSFSFGKNKLFNNINLIINKQDKVAFIGDSGSGKTTLVNILTTLIYDVEGNIYIDDIKITGSNRENWRKKIGYIPQDLYLFDGTVAENIIFSTGVYEEKKVIKVLKIAKIYDFFVDKEGLETQVGDNAIQLSGGQKQRLAIARALYNDPEILVLDEATSALDSKIEEEIMRDIYKITKNKTLIIIAHRLSTIEGCNRIIEVKEGELHEK